MCLCYVVVILRISLYDHVVVSFVNYPRGVVPVYVENATYTEIASSVGRGPELYIYVVVSVVVSQCQFICLN